MTLKIETLAIEKLAFDPTNARKHSDENLAAIASSLKEFGQRKPIVVTEGNVIVAGNGTVEAARLVGLTDVDVVRVPKSWSADQVKAFALADNRSAELAEWNPEVLSAQLLELEQAGFDIEALGFEAIEVNEEKPDEEPSFFDEGLEVSKLGDLWQVGPHRIMCADAMDESAIAKLLGGETPEAVITDPPYGISIVSNNQVGGSKLAKIGKYKPVLGDESPDIAAKSFALCQKLFSKALQVWWGANHYCGKANLPDSSCWIVWDKNNGANNFADAELAWTSSKTAVRVFKHTWNGMIRESERGKRVHPTQKPTALTAWLVETLKVKPESIILDLFAGSGSTLVGAGESGCVGYGIELDPFYVDVIVGRLEELTGEKAVLQNASG